MSHSLEQKIDSLSNVHQINNVRLILGDQLNAQHSWFQEISNSIVYVIAEVYEEATYVRHHIQKVSAFFLAMQKFASALQKAGHHVLYLTLDDTAEYASMPDLMISICQKFSSEKFEYQHPDEYRLALKMQESIFPCNKKCVSSEHFFLQDDEFKRYVKPNKHNRLENFYRKLRARFNVLMTDDHPEGGAWNFDSENRATFKSKDLNNIPEPLCFSNDVSDILKRIARHGIVTIGQSNKDLLWPVSRSQSCELLEYFCRYCLPNFGRFQDAMTGNSPHQWSLYHSRLSFALNTKMLSPKTVIQYALSAYYDSDGKITLPQIEGFVRQILGWREYIRAVYWVNMPDYCEHNVLDAQRMLPGYFWSGKTNMRCVKLAVEQSLSHAYAHHIQRLMITGNFCLLTGIEPQQVDEWYLGIYIDALEWVELPNTRGMSQWADGGYVATKPYCSGGNYINNMSDYCKSCHYDVKQKVGEKACPFNSLYWHFLEAHKERFQRNPRMAMIYRNWARQDQSKRSEVLKKAQYYLDNIETL